MGRWTSKVKEGGGSPVTTTGRDTDYLTAPSGSKEVRALSRQLDDGVDTLLELASARYARGLIESMEGPAPRREGRKLNRDLKKPRGHSYHFQAKHIHTGADGLHSAGRGSGGAGVSTEKVEKVSRAMQSNNKGVEVEGKGETVVAGGRQESSEIRVVHQAETMLVE